MPRQNKKHKLKSRILWPVLILAVIQSVLFASALLFSGTLKDMKQNAISVLHERTSNRKNIIENEMLSRWSNLSEMQAKLQASVDLALLDANAIYTDILPGTSIGSSVVQAVAQDVLYTLRKNSVTGAFVVFCGDDYQLPGTGSVNKTGIYIRDMDPEFTPNGNTDLFLERAPRDIATTLGITTDIFWTPMFELNPDDDYYFKPLHAAIANPTLETKDLGYWGHNLRLDANDIPIVTYSVPLRSADGAIFAIAGVEISCDYLHKIMPYSEIGSQSGSYAIAVDSDNNRDTHLADTVVYSGYGFKYSFPNPEQISFDNEYEYLSVRKAEGREGNELMASVQKLKLYNNGTPFATDEWLFVGSETSKELFAFTTDISFTIAIIFAISLLMGIVGAALITFKVTHPIMTLVQKVRESDPHLPVHLPQIDVEEMDMLAGAIEQLSLDVAETSSRISNIMDLSGLTIGVFEYMSTGETVPCSSGFYQLTGLKLESGGVPKTIFNEFITSLRASSSSGSKENFVGNITLKNGAIRYLSVRTKQTETELIGVIMDVTQDIIEKRKIEYERDNDVLTSLLNRRAFSRMAGSIFEKKENLGCAALMMLDLDNLKYVNDTYGHDCGDKYIRCAANVLRTLANNNIISARVSGDEFQVLLFGFASQKELRAIIDDIRAKMLNTKMILPDNSSFKVRASAGIAWYPTDATELDDLVRYADFAMYEVKNTIKGGIKDFNIDTYRRDSFLLHSKEELNRMIDEKLVDYAFQPIVDARTGEVFAYEALMRPQMPTLKSPMDVMRLAHSQSMLYQVEKLTWFCAMEKYKEKLPKMMGSRVFINSIANQMLTSEDFNQFKDLYADMFANIVVEITESEYSEKEYTENKLAFLRSMNLPIALDDFGTGYNSDMALLELKPSFVKIDMGIVRGIENDKNRRELFESLVSYSKQNGIKVIAEGVETYEELEVLVRGGADYFQGYYFGAGEMDPHLPNTSAIAKLLELSQNTAVSNDAGAVQK